jgi:hypothetical protein
MVKIIVLLVLAASTKAQNPAQNLAKIGTYTILLPQGQDPWESSLLLFD